jgi:hypothetical protein
MEEIICLLLLCGCLSTVERNARRGSIVLDLGPSGLSRIARDGGTNLWPEVGQNSLAQGLPWVSRK